MKAVPGLLAVLLMLSSPSFAQTAPASEAAPTQQAVPVQQAVPPAAPAPADQAAPAQQPSPAQPPAAGNEAAKPEAASQPPAATPPTAEATPANETSVAAADAAPAGPVVPATAFVPGAKLYLEPMDGFEQILAHEIVKKKVPVVLVHERAEADFVLSGVAHVHKRGFFTGFVLTTNGKGDVSINDARTGEEVFTHRFKRADGNMTPYLVYKVWAEGCAKDMKKTLEPKKK